VLSGDKEALSWECGKCTERERWVRNCERDLNPCIEWAWDSSLRRCPYSAIKPLTWMLLRAWLDWRELGQSLYGAAGLSARPAWEVESILLCQRMEHEIEAKRDQDRSGSGAAADGVRR
jgi:hypothetical protein